MTYVFAEQWHRERKRLAGVEAGADPISRDVLSRLGVGPGWRCAEVGRSPSGSPIESATLAGWSLPI
ncbi:MAG: hypothetical protein M3460_26035 [Actinomycetota bacterium]|nr:hypothetical protein [Actinomycetota bacterium]